MTNVLQFHSKEYKHCANLVEQYERLAGILMNSEGVVAVDIIKQLELIYNDFRENVRDISHKGQQYALAKRILDKNLDIMTLIRMKENNVL